MEDGSLPIDIRRLIVDQPDAYAIERAKNHGIPYSFVNPKDYANKAEFEKEVLRLLKEDEVDWIICSGYMRIIGPTLLDQYPEKIINLHPAYLPEFKGAHAISDAYEAGADQTGVTVHYIDAGIDTGPVILQERIAIDPKWSLDELETAVHAKEYEIFWKGIKKALEEGK